MEKGIESWFLGLKSIERKGKKIVGKSRIEKERNKY